MAIKGSGNLLSDSDIKKMIKIDKVFLEVLFTYNQILSKRNKFEMKLRILISKELEYYRRKTTTWFFGIIKENKNKIDEVIKEYYESLKGLEVA